MNEAQKKLSDAGESGAWEDIPKAELRAMIIAAFPHEDEERLEYLCRKPMRIGEMYEDDEYTSEEWLKLNFLTDPKDRRVFWEYSNGDFVVWPVGVWPEEAVYP